jgi:hypothetical protein
MLRSHAPRRDPPGTAAGVQPLGAQQVGEVLVGQQLAQCADDEQQVALRGFGFLTISFWRSTSR